MPLPPCRCPLRPRGPRRWQPPCPLGSSWRQRECARSRSGRLHRLDGLDDARPVEGNRAFGRAATRPSYVPAERPCSALLHAHLRAVESLVTQRVGDVLSVAPVGSVAAPVVEPGVDSAPPSSGDGTSRRRIALQRHDQALVRSSARRSGTQSNTKHSPIAASRTSISRSLIPSRTAARRASYSSTVERRYLWDVCRRRVDGWRDRRRYSNALSCDQCLSSCRWPSRYHRLNAFSTPAPMASPPCPLPSSIAAAASVILSVESRSRHSRGPPSTMPDTRPMTLPEPCVRVGNIV